MSCFAKEVQYQHHVITAAGHDMVRSNAICRSYSATSNIEEEFL